MQSPGVCNRMRGEIGLGDPVMTMTKKYAEIQGSRPEYKHVSLRNHLLLEHKAVLSGISHPAYLLHSIRRFLVLVNLGSRTSVARHIEGLQPAFDIPRR